MKKCTIILIVLLLSPRSQMCNASNLFYATIYIFFLNRQDRRYSYSTTIYILGIDDILTIAKLDGTLNDSPVDSLTWSGFPTMYYIKVGFYIAYY